MDPCPYIRILVGNLAIKFPKGAKPVASSSAVHPSTTPCYCKIRLADFSAQESSVHILNDEEQEEEEVVARQSSSSVLAACFTLGKKQVEAAVNIGESVGNSKYCLVVEIYVGGDSPVCGLWGTKGKLLGKVKIPLGWGEIAKLLQAENIYSRGFSLHNGWVGVGTAAQLRLKVRAEPDPRYVFEFGGEPEVSPHVFQVQGSSNKQNKQAVFTTKFSLRNPGDRTLGTRPSMAESNTPRKWLSSALGSDKDQSSKERKGWTVTIHDLSGSPVAMASMVTPFVPSPGSDRVSQSSPGAWLILQPSYGTWKPWGRLEAWRDRTNAVGYRFDLFNDTGIADPATSTLASSTISAKQGGTFCIDTTNTVTTPLTSPQGSFDLGSASPLTHFAFKGFVMSATVETTGKSSRPVVEIGAQHVACTEDAAAFVALAAALDLSMDACTLFTSKLRKELRHQISHSVSV